MWSQKNTDAQVNYQFGNAENRIFVAKKRKRDRYWLTLICLMAVAKYIMKTILYCWCWRYITNFYWFILILQENFVAIRSCEACITFNRLIDQYGCNVRTFVNFHPFRPMKSLNAMTKLLMLLNLQRRFDSGCIATTKHYSE